MSEGLNESGRQLKKAIIIFAVVEFIVIVMVIIYMTLK